MRNILCLLIASLFLFSSCNKKSDNEYSDSTSFVSQNIKAEENLLAKEEDINFYSEKDEDTNQLDYINYIREYIKGDNITFDTLCWTTEASSDTLIDGLHIGIAYKRSLDESEYILYDYYSIDESGEEIEIKDVSYGMQGLIVLCDETTNRDTIIISRNDIAQILGFPNPYAYGLWGFNLNRVDNDTLVFESAIMQPESDVGPKIEVRIKREVHPTVATIAAIDIPLDEWLEEDTVIIKRFPLKLRYKNNNVSPQ